MKKKKKNHHSHIHHPITVAIPEYSTNQSWYFLALSLGQLNACVWLRECFLIVCENPDDEMKILLIFYVVLPQAHSWKVPALAQTFQFDM